MSESYQSDYPVERLIIAGSLPVLTVSANNVSIAHNLGYRPFVRLFASYPGGTLSDVVGEVGKSPDSNIEISVSLTTTTLSFVVFDNTFTDRSMTIYYRIYTEQLA